MDEGRGGLLSGVRDGLVIGGTTTGHIVGSVIARAYIAREGDER